MIRKDFFTRAVHSGASVDPNHGAVMPAIQLSTTFAQEAPGKFKQYDYSRGGNPTRQVLESALAGIEASKYSLAFSSGLAAIQSVVQLLEPGDHMLVCDDVYGGTGRLFRLLFAKYGIEFDFIDMTEPSAIGENVRTDTKAIWIETPTNPTLKVIDIKKAAEVARDKKILLIVDNTFATPINQSPLELGADICMHSTTKYIGGHTDLLGGALMVNDDEIYQKLKFVQFAAGAVPSPFDCYQMVRSIRTLAIRMQKHNENAMAIATHFENHPKIEKVYYPGLTSHMHHEIAAEQMRGFSGVISMRFKSDLQGVTKMLQSMKYFLLAESLGGVESLVNHPEQMTHQSVPKPLRDKLGITENLLRFSVGIEDHTDLINDIEQALDHI